MMMMMMCPQGYSRPRTCTLRIPSYVTLQNWLQNSRNVNT